MHTFLHFILEDALALSPQDQSLRLSADGQYLSSQAHTEAIWQ